ncbi:hypothetical protein BDZ91DRAFT_666433 [Kalaharituber pfeilii]|nr:hypothetical protein BDZ91DRAFT_666433 [Kalaharituber pfeilii]
MSPVPLLISNGPDRDLAIRGESVNGATQPSQSLVATVPTVNFYPKITDRAQLIQKLKAGEAVNWSTNYTVGESLHQLHANVPREEDTSRRQSALHSGVFTDDSNGGNFNHPPTPIASTFDISFRNAFQSDDRTVIGPSLSSIRSTQQNGQDSDLSVPPTRRRLRGNSITSLSSFVFKVPTSPLVYSSSPDHMDTESTSPHSSALGWTQLDAPMPALPSSLSSLHGISSRNQPYNFKRRSMPEAYVDGPLLRQPRRLSSGVGSGSELPFGSFVGSYEESILNGRMSTTPSKPLMFVAKIGVLGMGKCKSALKCPTHVTIPFPAYFYSVGDYDSPSPYVGQIDLEMLAEKANKKFPYGGYRIPQQGQLQIVIKNPNKTAVKLFLVPYDLRDMEPSTKTFVRQKSFAAGNAILDEILPPTEQHKIRNRERESLRYLIHLHICCPSRGRYYLYRNIRVVFANRVPDGKEKLRNEISMPNPKYSSWKPGRETASACSSVTSVGRKRSQSSFGDTGDQLSKSINLGVPAEGEREERPPMPALPAHYMAWNQSSALARVGVTLPPPLQIPKPSGTYDKIPASVYSSSNKSEGHGLLARKLKGLDVEEQE